MPTIKFPIYSAIPRPAIRTPSYHCIGLLFSGCSPNCFSFIFHDQKLLLGFRWLLVGPSPPISPDLPLQSASPGSLLVLQRKTRTAVGGWIVHWERAPFLRSTRDHPQPCSVRTGCSHHCTQMNEWCAYLRTLQHNSPSWCEGISRLTN